MNLPNSLSVTRIFLVPLLVVVLLTKFEGRMILGVRKELVGAAIFGIASFTDWLDGYLARRRQQVTRARPVHRSVRRQAADDRRVHLAGADGSGAGVDGRDHHRPRVRGHGAAHAGPRARRVDAGVAARQDQDGRAGRGDPRADSRQGSSARLLRDRPGGAVGGGGDGAACRRPTTSAASACSSTRRSSPLPSSPPNAQRQTARPARTRPSRSPSAGRRRVGGFLISSMRFCASSRCSLCSNSSTSRSK